MSEDKIDLSAIDPARDRERWEARIQQVAQRALVQRPRARRGLAPTLGDQLLAWFRPALALAAVLALLVWGAALLGVGRRGERPGGRREAGARATQPAVVLARWAADDARPEPTEVLLVLGGHHDGK